MPDDTSYPSVSRSDPTDFHHGLLAITVTDGVASATPGTSTTYTITASNAGPDGVTGASVSDAFPAPLSCNWTCAGAGGGLCSALGSGSIADTVDLPVAASVTYAATCTISPSATGSLSNTATITGGATADPNSANNSATDSDTLTPLADVSITKTGPAFARRNESLVYTIVVSNTGPSDAVFVDVTDTPPAGLTFVSNTGDCSTAFTCTFGSLIPGESRTITSAYSVPADYDVGIPIVNTATVTTTTPDSDTANDISTATSRFGAFYPVAPCRVVDTRTAAWLPALQPSEERTLALTGPCGIPVGAVAVSINLAITSPQAAGHLSVFPTGATAPLISSINFSAGQTRANNAVVSAAADGSASVTVLNASTGTVHCIVDVNGYFE
jgi:uncharacterized repeat protein (TIGR01451 family)